MNDDPKLFELVPDAAGDASFLGELADRLRDAGRWPELLEVRLMQARLRHGLPVDAPSLAAAPEPARRRLEDEYTVACEEVGAGLLDAGRYREAWFYLNTAGKGAVMRDALAGLTPDEESSEELIEIALHEGANPAVGFGWLIDAFGTCNAVTSLEGIGPHLPLDDLRGCAAKLVSHLHAELSASIASHVEADEGAPPAEATIAEQIARRPHFFEQPASHVDASHLSATVRMARVIEEPDLVQQAWQLANYGAHLDASLHYADAPPFDDIYTAHRLFFAAQLAAGSAGDTFGESDINAAVAYFRERAEACNPELQGLAPVETLLVLLSRVGRAAEALREYGRLTPLGAALSPYAPRPIDLARASGDWEAFAGVMRQRGDVVTLAQGALARSDDPPPDAPHQVDR